MLHSPSSSRSLRPLEPVDALDGGPAARRATDAAISAEITDAAVLANQPPALDLPPPPPDGRLPSPAVFAKLITATVTSLELHDERVGRRRITTSS